MKKNYLLFSILSLLFIVYSCTEDDEIQEPTSTDISVNSSENLIVWLDDNDLNQQLTNALTYNYGNALESEVEKNLTFNSDSTQVVATINFKQEFQHTYFDPDISNNKVSIDLSFGVQHNHVNSIVNSEFFNPASVNFMANVNATLANSPLQDLSSVPIVIVPIKFHDIYKNNGSGNSLNISYIPTLLQRLNTKFAAAKIEFIQCGDVNQIYNSDWYDFPAVDYSGNNGVDFAYLENIMNLHNVPYVLNIYFPSSITGAGGFYPGFEQPPHLESMLMINKDLLEIGLVVEHEIGHWLYLPHTHGNGNMNGTSDELVDGSNCTVAGDLICDTPADPNLYNLVTQDGNCEYIGNGVDLNGHQYNPNTLNIMSYTYYECRNNFSSQQLLRMGILMRTNLRNFISSTVCGNNNTSNISLSNDIDFGNIQVNASSTKILTVSNTGNASFNITNITSSNNAFTILNGQSSTVSPNSSVNFDIQFSPTQEQAYNGVITVDNNADNANSSNSSIQVTGVGVNNNTSNISVNGNLNFGNVEIGQSDTRTFTISNTGNQSFNVSSISFPSSVYSANWNSGTISAGGSQNVIVTFQPTNVQSYNGTVTVNHNAASGNNTISINGSGVNNNQNVILSYNDHLIKDGTGGGVGNSNGIPEAGEEIDLDLRLINTGNTIATNVSAVLTTNDPDINITDSSETWADIPAGATEWADDFDFDISTNCPTKTVTFNLQITSDQGTWNDSFTINIQGSSGGNPISITPTDSCNSSPIMQVNTEYEVSINVGNYSFGTPIEGESAGGNNVRGFWLSFQVPSNWSANHDVKIYDVSSNFNPVMGIRANCNGPYLGQGNFPPFPLFINDNGSGGNETSDTNIPGSNNGGTPDDIYHVRIYHYDGSQTPNISFKIIIE